MLEHPEARDQTPIRDDEPIKFYFNGRYKAAEKSALKFADNRLTEMSLDPDVSACELSALVEAVLIYRWIWLVLWPEINQVKTIIF